MKEKKTNYGYIIFILVLVILFVPIISDYISKMNIEVLSKKAVVNKQTDKESFILYIGDVDKDTNKELLSVRNSKSSDILIDYNVYSIKKDSVDKSLKDKIVAIYIEGDLQKTYDKYDNKSILNDIDIYYEGNIVDSEKSYKVAEDYKDYKTIVNSDEVTMAVFGRNSCGWCNKFKPVYNAVAEKYGIDIYYFDSDNYNSSDYEKIVNMNLVVPAKCSSSGNDFKLSDGFGTPLSVFTKNGKIVDCISGYSDRASLIKKLKENKIISE